MTRGLNSLLVVDHLVVRQLNDHLPFHIQLIRHRFSETETRIC